MSWGTIPDEVGGKYDIGFSSPTWGSGGFVVKPGTYYRTQQLIKRQDVVGALQQAMADRDISFWTRITQSDWSYGSGQELFGTSTDSMGSFTSSQCIDNHVPGQINLVPQPSVLDSVTSGAIYRGACLVRAGAGGAAKAFFAYTAGNYRWTADITAAAPVFSTNTTGGAGNVLDICSDGTNVYFAVTGGGIWYTTVAAPGNLAQYNTGVQVYHRLVYDPLRKLLFGITAPSVGASFDRINSGGASTVINDFAQGQLDAIDNYNGNIFLAWNTGSAFDGSTARSVIFYYNGSSVIEYLDMGAGSQTVGISRGFSTIFFTVLNADTFDDPDDIESGISLQLYGVLSSGTFNLGTLDDGVVLQDSTTFSPFTSGQFMMCLAGTPNSPGASQFVASTGLVWRWDFNFVGLSRSFGSTQISVSGTTYDCLIQGLIAVNGKMIANVALLTAGAIVGGAIVQLSGATNGITALATGDCQIVGSRMDLGLPYVEKYWYAFEINCDPLLANQSILAEYSLDDGATWTACTNYDTGNTNPYSVLGGTRYVAQIKQVSPTVRYRLTLTATSTTTPYVHAVSTRFAPSNPNLKMWTLTVNCFEQERLRNNVVASDLNAQDMLTYLMNIAQQSETVTFYDANEELTTGAVRPPHTVWVAQANQYTANTGGVYNQYLQEGEVSLILWEAGQV